MSFKTMHVHIDDAAGCKQRLDVAIKLALDFRAQLVGVYLVPNLELSPSVAAVLPADMVERRLRDNAEAQHQAEDEFRKAAAAAGLASLDWRAPAGPAIDAAVAHGRCTDLFIMGQRDPETPGLLFAEELIATVVLSSGRPMLIVPVIGAQPTLGENVLIAWDGGREAARAAADALPFLERAKRVAVVAVNPDGGRPTNDPSAGPRLAAWLRQHGVEVDAHHYDIPDIRTGEWLLSQAADLGSDLIVMGGYGHTRMRELVLGGVTRTMLRSMTVPVLMSH